jgi:hypothetical protein
MARAIRTKRVAILMADMEIKGRIKPVQLRPSISIIADRTLTRELPPLLKFHNYFLRWEAGLETTFVNTTRQKHRILKRGEGLTGSLKRGSPSRSGKLDHPSGYHGDRENRVGTRPHGKATAKLR